jgi:hypothetical protein
MPGHVEQDCMAADFAVISARYQRPCKLPHRSPFSATEPKPPGAVVARGHSRVRYANPGHCCNRPELTRWSNDRELTSS